MLPNDFLVPITCNQSFNRSIKKLCELAGLDSPVTTVRIVGNKRIEQYTEVYHTKPEAMRRETELKSDLYAKTKFEHFNSASRRYGESHWQETNMEIARKLSASIITVKNHIINVKSGHRFKMQPPSV